MTDSRLLITNKTFVLAYSPDGVLFGNTLTGRGAFPPAASGVTTVNLRFIGKLMS